MSKGQIRVGYQSTIQSWSLIILYFLINVFHISNTMVSLVEQSLLILPAHLNYPGLVSCFSVFFCPFYVEFPEPVRRPSFSRFYVMTLPIYLDQWVQNVLLVLFCTIFHFIRATISIWIKQTYHDYVLWRSCLVINFSAIYSVVAFPFSSGTIILISFYIQEIT